MAKKEGAGLPAVRSSNGFPIATQEDLENFAFMDANALDVVRENLGGQNISPNDFERLKFPAGGNQSWEIFGLDGESQSTKSIDGIVLMQKTNRFYWANAYTGEGSPPDCQSRDLKTGVGTPGGNCATCPYAQWGSDPKGGEGQACKTVGALFVMKPGESLPVVVPVPVGSLKNVRKFMLSLSSKNIRYSNAIIGIGLEPDKNKQGIPYSKIKPKLIAVLPQEAQVQINKYIEAFKNSMEAATISREQAESAAAN